MKIYVDIDNTICLTSEINRDYTKAEPIVERIKKINELYDQGNTIIYWTARGSRTKTDWSALTVSQLDSWGCKRDNIVFGKPDYDLFIEDKSMHPKDFFND
jgi:hypothetical protein